MITTVDILNEILRTEGWPKYTNDPADAGGPTKGGITLGTLAQWRNRPTTTEDVQKLTEDEARQIYTALYIVRPNFVRITDPLLRATVVDSGVLHGTGTASEWLQVACNRERLVIGIERIPEIAELVVDGRIGPKSLAVINSLPGETLRQRVIAKRIRETGRIIQIKQNVRFSAGWSNRIAGLIEKPLDQPRTGV